MPETSLEKVVLESAFLEVLGPATESLFRLANTLSRVSEKKWGKRHTSQLISEAEALESFLDDYGARYNRTYVFFTEITASVRGFSLAAYSVEHLAARIDSYGARSWFEGEERVNATQSFKHVRVQVRGWIQDLLVALLDEARELGLNPNSGTFPEDGLAPAKTRVRLPRNVGQDEPENEEQKIAGFASHFIQAAEMLRQARVRRIQGDAAACEQYLERTCTEEQARVYEATVHNLQSAYDTYIKNTVLEARDDRLGRLRGYASASLHILEAVTFLRHFCERHESEARSEESKRRIARLVDRDKVQEVTLNHLFYWADRLLADGRGLAEELLPSYTNVQELQVELPGNLVLHARPASLIVAIVNQHGTPVELEIGGARCNAASILELLVAVGSNPEQRVFLFRGDERPLRDIADLFQSGLGEGGMESLPASLGYLRQR